MKNQTDIEFTRARGRYTAKQFYTQKDWYQEYLDSGAQYRMTFTQFKKQKQKLLKPKKQNAKQRKTKKIPISKHEHCEVEAIRLNYPGGYPYAQLRCIQHATHIQYLTQDQYSKIKEG